MNIELKLNFDEIHYIAKNIESILPVSLKAINKTQFFTFSIIFDIAKMIKKKEILLDYGQGVNTKKKYKIKFKYHEAVILEKFMSGYQETEQDPFYANIARNITGQLNQKLA